MRPESGYSCLSHACRSGRRLVPLLWITLSDRLISRGPAGKLFRAGPSGSRAEEMKTAQSRCSSCQLARYLSRCQVDMLQTSTCSWPLPSFSLSLCPPCASVSAALFFSVAPLPNGGRLGRLPQESGTVGRFYVLSLSLLI